jgi:hypothetical protein
MQTWRVLFFWTQGYKAPRRRAGQEEIRNTANENGNPDPSGPLSPTGLGRWPLALCRSAAAGAATICSHWLGRCLYCAAMMLTLRSLLCACLAALASGCASLNLQMVDRSVQKPSNIAVYFTVDTACGVA